MTPKEKAKELIARFKLVTYYDRSETEPVDYSHLAIPAAKECALIAVDEIVGALSEYDNRNDAYELQNMDRDFNYWEKVKQGIESL